MKTLLIHNLETATAEKIALELNGEIEYKKSHFRIHTKKSFDMKSYRLLCDFDLNIFDNNFDYQNIRLMVSDMDSTLITVETIDEVAKEVGLTGEISSITERAMQGDLDFTESFVKRVSLLEGISSSNLINHFKSNQVKTAMVSGGLNFFAKKLQAELEIEKYRANNVEIINGLMTGNVLGKVVDAKEKAAYIKELCEEFNLKNDQVVAIGDGANDIEMMKVAGMSVAYHAKPLLKEYCNIQINFGGLDSLIHFFE